MKVIIDRFEGDVAVVELPSGEPVHVPRILFENACEGDHAEITVLGKPFNRDSEDGKLSETAETRPSVPFAEAEESESVSAQETDEIVADENPAEIFKRLRKKSKKRR